MANLIPFLVFSCQFPQQYYKGGKILTTYNNNMMQRTSHRS
jgi:hypothetical protein